MEKNVTRHELLSLTRDVVVSAVRKDDFVIAPEKIAEMIEEVYDKFAELSTRED